MIGITFELTPGCDHDTHLTSELASITRAVEGGVPLPKAHDRRLRTAATTLVSAVALLLAGCSGDTGNPEDTVVRTVLASDPSSFDPARAQGQQTFQMVSLLYDTLLRRDGPSTLVGGLASQWETVSASEYVFTIRDGATCSDGTPITASVVAASLNHLAAPETASTWKNLVFGQGEATIAADDASKQVRITLSQPFTTLVQGLAIAQTGIVCPAGLADPDGLAAGRVAGAFSGPYTVSEANAGVGYTFTLRGDYDAWPAFSTALVGTPPGSIEIGISTDPSTVANQILAGDVDLGQFSDQDTIARFEGQPDYHRYDVTTATTYVVFNQRPGRVFADRPDLRRAVAAAIDQNAFNTVFSDGTAEVLTTVVPASFACASTDPSLPQPHDAAAAAAVLPGVQIAMLGNTANPSYSGGADYIFQVLSDAGAQVRMNKVDNATFWSTIAEGGSDWDLVFLGDLNSVGSISASLDRVIGPAVEAGGRNYSASVNPEGEAALSQGLAATDPAARCAAFEAAQRTLFERSDVVPLAGNPTTYITSPHVVVSTFGEYVDFATLRVIDA
jgi:peptide/nickel transport system substrate-binding protein